MGTKGMLEQSFVFLKSNQKKHFCIIIVYFCIIDCFKLIFYPYFTLRDSVIKNKTIYCKPYSHRIPLTQDIIKCNHTAMAITLLWNLQYRSSNPTFSLSD